MKTEDDGNGCEKREPMGSWGDRFSAGSSLEVLAMAISQYTYIYAYIVTG
jgi:hypothetical protein